MADKYRVEIGVKSVGGMGGGTSGRSSVGDVREQARATKELASGIKSSMDRPKSAGRGSFDDMGPIGKIFGRVAEEIKQLRQEFSKGGAGKAARDEDKTKSRKKETEEKGFQDKLERIARGNVGGRIGGAVGSAVGKMMPASIGGGVGAMGAGLGFGVGALLGGVGWAWQKVSQIGQANMAAAAEQRTTAGIAGTRTSRLGYYGGAEMGQLVKAQRLAYGEMTNEGPDFSQYETRYGTRYNSKTKKNESYSYKVDVGNVAGNYGKAFGIGGQEIGSLLGKMMTVTGNTAGQGTKEMSRVLSIGRLGGTTLTLQSMMGVVSEQLEEAVKDGIESSTMARDIATEIATKQAWSGNFRNIAPITSGFKKLAGDQSAVGQGQYGTLPQMMMMQIGIRMAQEKVKLGAIDEKTGEYKDEMIKLALKRGVLSESQIGPNAKEPLTASQIKVLAELLNAQKNPEIRKEFINTAYNQFTNQKAPEHVRKAELTNILQAYSGYSAGEIAAMISGIGKPLGRESTGKEKLERDFKEQISSGGAVFRGVGFENMMKDTVLTNAAAGMAAQKVYEFNKSMTDLAGQLAGPTAAAMEVLGNAMTGVVNQAGKLVSTLNEVAGSMSNKSSGDIAKDIIKGAIRVTGGAVYEGIYNKITGKKGAP